MKKKIKLPALITGTFKDKSGKLVDVTKDFMSKVKSATEKFQYPGGLIPIVKGHPKEEDPAYGHVKNTALQFDDKGQLYAFADVDDLDPDFYEDVKKKKYNKVSVAIRKDGSIRHFGTFGAHPTAIPLDPISFAEEDDMVFQFGECNVTETDTEIIFGAADNLEISDWPFRNLRQLLRRLKNWLVESEGAEEAEKILPEWDLDSIGEPPRIFEKVSTEKSFSESINEEDMKLSPEVQAQLDAANEKIEKLTGQLTAATSQLSASEREKKFNSALAFCESDEMKNKIPPALGPSNVANLLVELEGVGEIEFSEGEETKKVTAVDTVKAILKMLPEMEFSEMAVSGINDAEVKAAQTLGDEIAGYGSIKS